MGMLSGLRTVHSIMSGAFTSAQLQTHLGVANNLASFKQVMQSPYQLDVIFSDPLAYGVLFGSALGCQALVQSKLALNDVLTTSELNAAFFASTVSGVEVMAHPVSFDTVLASTSWSTLLVSTTQARSALWNSDTYLSKFAASATGIAGLKLQAGIQTDVTTNTNTFTQTFPIAPTGNHILVTTEMTDPGTTSVVLTLGGRRAGSTVGTTVFATTANAIAVTNNIMAISTSFTSQLSPAPTVSTTVTITSFPVA